MRWEDYTQTAMDPADDCTIWVRRRLHAQRTRPPYSTKIGAFRMPGCPAGEAAQPPVPPRPSMPAEPTPADLLRGAYGRYRANKRPPVVRPRRPGRPRERSPSAGPIRIRFRMLNDDARIQLDLFANLSVDGLSLARARSQVRARVSTPCFVDFPEPLKEGQGLREFAFPLFRNRASERPVRRHRLPDGSGRAAVDQHRLPAHRRPASGGPTRPVRDEVEEMHLRVAHTSDLVDVFETEVPAGEPTSATATPLGLAHPVPINNYSVSLNIGHYTHFTDEADGQPLDFYCLPETSRRRRRSSRRRR